MPDEPTTLASEPAQGGLIGGRYRVVRALGQGGMGAVYEAEHVDIEKRVALKVLHPSFAKDPLLRERFLREARAAARIGHPNVVDITDFGTTDSGVVFIVMELLEGRDLAAMLEARRAIPWGEALPLLRQICGALAAAHELGIVHRDVKPENVFLVPRPDGSRRVKLVDFGIAKLLHDRNQPKLTAVGEVHGTPGYIAPEQITGGTVDRRADVYAVGVMAYRMVTGELPFVGDNIMQVLTRQLQETPAPPRAAARDPSSLPEGIDDVLLRAIARQVEDRFDSMNELASALEALAPVAGEDEGGATLPPSAVADPGPTLKLRGRRNTLPLAAFVVLLLGAAAVGLTLLPGGHDKGAVRRDAQTPPTIVDSGTTTASRCDGGQDLPINASVDAAPPTQPRHGRRGRRPKIETPGRRDSAKTNKTAPFKAKGDLIDPWHTAP